ncbi:purine nucleoside permease [Mycena amicta]|nr:purine nucleoside permease [Mycena amicta]
MPCRLLVTLLPCLVLALCCEGCVNTPIQPKVLIITMFDSETNLWFNIPEFNIVDCPVSFPGLSPLYPSVHCTNDGSICLVTTGQAEINAASTMSAVVYSGYFNLTSTYFLIAGVAGVNPEVATIGAVTFARYAVQVGLQYELDSREIPAGFSTGYFPQGSTGPAQLPAWYDGTEVFELNDALRQAVFEFSTTATLSDSAKAQAARALYSNASAGATGPRVVLCDTATSDTYWSGDLLGEAVESTMKLLTNGMGNYCTTQQEDNATLNVLLRAAVFHLVDFGRVIVMRSASDFDRPYPGQTAVANLLGPTPGFVPSLNNLYLVGVRIIEGIIGEWDTKFAVGVKATNYIGDVFGSLGGDCVPDFGPRSK